MLGEVEETIYTVEEDDDGEETVKVSVRMRLVETESNGDRRRKSSQKCYLFEVHSPQKILNTHSLTMGRRLSRPHLAATSIMRLAVYTPEPNRISSCSDEQTHVVPVIQWLATKTRLEIWELGMSHQELKQRHAHRPP